MPELTTLPSPGGTSHDAEEFSHAYCCDPDRSLCGLDISCLTDLGEVPPGDDEEMCPVCDAAAAIGGPCGVPGCEGGAGWREFFGGPR
jgi:hypothetical protein